ncbi:MAG: hypothetical protein V4662_12535 [Verrucomicrobiota bacterium]
MLLACATCKADPNSLIAQAQDIAVLVMLAFLVLGMACVGLIVFHFVRRQQRFAAAASVPS